MSNIPIGQTPQVSLQALLPPGGRAQLDSSQEAVASAVVAFRAGQPSAVDSGDWAFFEAAFKGSAGMDPRFNLTDLPPEIAQMILDSQAKTMQEFFDTWAKSIAENAKADVQAHERSQELKEQLGKPMDGPRQRLLFKSALNWAVNASSNPDRPAALRISSVEAQRIAEEHGLAAEIPSPPMSKSGWQAVPQQQLPGAFIFPTGGKTGVST